MKTSDEIKDLAAALAKAQGEIKNPAKQSTNPHFRSNYADLATGINAIKAALSANGITYTQATYMAGDLIMLETRLIHSTGQWISSDYPIIRFPAKQQEIGSADTYARRYSLFSLVGIAGEDEDDDGNAAVTPVVTAPAKPVPQIKNSADKADELIDEMSDIFFMSELKAWAKDVKPVKDALKPEDGKRVFDAYKERERLIMEEASTEQLAK